tara:strand:+ start:265 stop:516 length:252 start_codon:yes stop_codon:yes gene_type:complete
MQRSVTLKVFAEVSDMHLRSKVFDRWRLQARWAFHDGLTDGQVVIFLMNYGLTHMDAYLITLSEAYHIKVRQKIKKRGNDNNG